MERMRVRTMDDVKDADPLDKLFPLTVGDGVSADAFVVFWLCKVAVETTTKRSVARRHYLSALYHLVPRLPEGIARQKALELVADLKRG